VSWFREAIEGSIVGSLGRQESPLEAVEGKIEELLKRSPAPARIMLLVAVDIS